MQTGVYQGVLIPPNFAVTLKWYEVAKHYKLADLGAGYTHHPDAGTPGCRGYRGYRVVMRHAGFNIRDRS